jgi:biotin synthase-related radical SAM superfamily protein/uncharacterized radical SAM superfamily protein
MKQSPAYAQLSLAADMTLGFRRGRFWRDARMTCINLLVTYANGCRANCSYCGLARDRVADERTFIHVPWPVRSMDEIIERLNQSPVARRTCISMITHPRAADDTLTMARRLTSETPQPVSILLGPTVTDKDYLSDLRTAGVDKIGIAIDAATEELFIRHRGKAVRGPHRWETYWKRFTEAVQVFGPGNVGSHFIVGLGEREEDLACCFQQIKDIGGVNHLFSFFPEAGGALEDLQPPPIDAYRRLQIACHLIDEELSSYQDFRFDSERGRIVNFGVSEDVLRKVIDSGEPFVTRGCKGCDGKVDCNRPFGNSYPGPDLRNYPFKPDEEDLRLVREQLAGQGTTRYDNNMRHQNRKRTILFAVPNFKKYAIKSYSNRGKTNFLAVSVTGGSCRLLCDHCRAKLLEPMIKTTTPESLWQVASRVAERGGEGLLVSGGSTEDGIVPLEPFIETMTRIKGELELKLAVHSKFLSRPLARALARTGLDAIMVDAPASEKIIREIYHLPHRGFRDVEETMNLMEEFGLPAAPHLLLGFGDESNRLEGITKVLDILQGRKFTALAVVFLMPLPGTPMPKPEPMPLDEVDALFARLRRMFSDTSVCLGCARPPGPYQIRLESLALKHRFDSIAFPTDETVELARKRRYEVQFRECCCAIAG